MATASSKGGFDYAMIADVKDPGWKMCIPLLLCAAGVVVLGLCSNPLVDFFREIATGLY